MNIEIKYNVGDNVHYRMAKETSQFVTCPFCNGTKQVQGHDSSILPCPKCDGSGKVKTVEYREGSAEISGIHVQYNSEDLRNYPNGPIVVYSSNIGNISQEEVVGKVVPEN